ncbi:MAG: LysR family transcriptional regulator [Parasporobacterium sp.]|nr:LysR family transcriptional regulator [Parasporobacterium sp.]
MTLTQIEYFIDAAESRNFSKTAERKYVSQQVVSSQIKALETELDIILFDRTNRRSIVLTEEGRLLYSIWRDLYEDFTHSLKVARSMKFSRKNYITIGVESGKLITDYVLPLIYKIKTDLPGIDFSYEFGPAAEIVDKVENGELDYCIVLSSEYNGKIGCDIIKHMNLRPGIAMSVNHPLANRKNVTLADIKDEPKITFKNFFAKNAFTRMTAEFLEAGLVPTNFIYVDDINTIEAMVRACSGITMCFIEQFSNKDGIKWYPIHGGNNGMDINLVMLWKDHKNPQIVDAFTSD